MSICAYEFARFVTLLSFMDPCSGEKYLGDHPRMSLFRMGHAWDGVPNSGFVGPCLFADRASCKTRGLCLRIDRGYPGTGTTYILS